MNKRECGYNKQQNKFKIGIIILDRRIERILKRTSLFVDFFHFPKNKRMDFILTVIYVPIHLVKENDFRYKHFEYYTI